MKVALFSGHVGKDSGAISDAKTGSDLYTIESTIVSAITSKISTLFKLIGVEYIIGIGPFDKRLKTTELCDVGISLHCDSIANKNVRGYHVIHYPGSANGERLAQFLDCIINDMCHYSRARSIHAEKFKIIRDTKFPCVLLECGFISNNQDEELLNTEDYQWGIAFAVVSAIKMYH